MNSTLIRRLCVVTLIVLFASSLSPNVNTFAQGDDDPAVLQARLALASANFNELQSYTQLNSYEQEITIVITLDIPNQDAFESRLVQRSNGEMSSDVILNGTLPNVRTSLLYSAASEQSSPDGASMDATSFEAQLRLVDDSLYFNPSFISGEGNIVPPESGWRVIVDSVLDAPENDTLGAELAFTGSESMQLAVFKDFILPEDTSTAQYLAVALDMMDNADGFRLEQSTLPDGTPIDLIVMTLSSESFSEMGFIDVAVDTDDIGALLEPLFETLTIDLNFALDADDNLRGYFFEIALESSTDDIHGILGDDVPDGVTGTIEITLAFSQATRYNNLGATFEPVETPEIIETEATE